MRSGLLRVVLALSFLAGLACIRSVLTPIVKPSATPADLSQAIDIVWHSYDGEAPPPHVQLVTGSDLNCQNGTAFLVPHYGCVYGLTLAPGMCVVAYTGKPFHETALAHELLHAVMLRRGIVDINHESENWKPGGELERANIELAKAGM